MANQNWKRTYLLGEQHESSLFEDFAVGASPQGWQVATSGGGSQVNFTQDYEPTIFGQARLLANQAVVQNRAGLTYASNYNYLLRLDDARYTTWFAKVAANVIPTTAVMQVGLSNVVPAVLLNGFGNTISLRYDPENRAGDNPALILNWTLVVKNTVTGSQSIDTGVLPSIGWIDVLCVFDNTGLAPVIKLYINDKLQVTLADMTNVPVNIISAPNAALKPIAFVGTGETTGGAAVQLKLDKFTLYKIWS